MSEDSTFSPTDVAFALAQRGIRASRDRIARMADALYGRDKREAGRHRRFTSSQVEELGAALLLIEGGASREAAARMVQDPAAAANEIQVAANKRIEALTRVHELSQAMTA